MEGEDAEEASVGSKEKVEVAELECDRATNDAGLGDVSDEELGAPWSQLVGLELDISAEHVVSIGDFLRTGGAWGGAEASVRRAIAIGQKHGLVVTSLKRSWGRTGSDHHVSQTRSFAADLSNGSSPTLGMDRTAHEIGQNLGVPDYRGGMVLNRRHGSVRAQLIWRWTGHFNHVHFGVRIM